MSKDKTTKKPFEVILDPYDGDSFTEIFMAIDYADAAKQAREEWMAVAEVRDIK